MADNEGREGKPKVNETAATTKCLNNGDIAALRQVQRQNATTVEHTRDDHYARAARKSGRPAR